MINQECKEKVHIRWMIRKDMCQVVPMQQEWTEENFLKCLRDNHTIGMVAEQGEEIFGFMIYKLHKEHIEILNFCVNNKDRRRGVGSQMIEKLIKKLSSRRRTKITTVVEESNLEFLLFLKRMGFRATQVLRGLFEDGYLMEYKYEDL